MVEYLLIVGLIGITVLSLVFHLKHTNASWRRRVQTQVDLHALNMENWGVTEDRLIERIDILRQEKLVSEETIGKLTSVIVTMRQEGFGGPGTHTEAFEEPESYVMTNSAELAEFQRRNASLEGTDEELLAEVRSRLANEIEEYEEPEVM